MIFQLDEKEVLDRYDCERGTLLSGYSLISTSHSCIFKTTGGYIVSCERNLSPSFCGAIDYFISKMKKLEPDDNKEDIENDLLCHVLVMFSPALAFGNTDRAINIAQEVIGCVKDMEKEAEETALKELTEEDENANKEFETMERGFETIKDLNV